jgi:hypothetical protein
MVTLTRVLFVVLALLLVAPARAADITLPEDHAFGTLKPGTDRALVQETCSLCHSTDYIVTQPPGDGKQWEAVVTKMIKVFGAPLDDQEAKAIVEYLTRQYGK